MSIMYVRCPAHLSDEKKWMHPKNAVCTICYKLVKEKFPELKKLLWDSNLATMASSRETVVKRLIAERLWRKKVDELKAAVVKILVTEFDFTTEDAEEKVDESFRNDKDMWNENAEPKDLAEYLANDDDDE